MGRAAPHERAVALSLVFANLGPTERDRRVANALVEPGADDLWVARRGERVVGAMRATIQPGRTAFTTPPGLSPGEPQATAHALSNAVVRHLETQNVQLAQALPAADQGPEAEALLSTGFRHVSNLLYQVSLRRSFPAAESAAMLEFIGYTEAEHDRLRSIVERTYEGSLDCPAVDRVRDVDDVLAGYRATGAFDPNRWLIVNDGAEDVGCLLLADYPSENQWELVYMGLVSEARGRGLGVSIVRHAQWMARQAGRKRLVLAVDADNAPAIAVYAACGFVTWDHRSVFVRVFGTV